MEQGKMQCAESRGDQYACPDGCNVCITCMLLVGCEDVYSTVANNPEGDNGKNNTLTPVDSTLIPWVLASALGILLAFAIMLRFKRTSQNNHGENNDPILSPLSPDPITKKKVPFLTERPTRVELLAMGEIQDEGQVWLAPII